MGIRVLDYLATAFGCGFNRSTQHIREIVEPGYRSLAFSWVVRLIGLPLRRAGPESSSTDPVLWGNTASAGRWYFRLNHAAKDVEGLRNRLECRSRA